MNAPARIKAAPAWEKYFPAIDALRPGCSDSERRQRAGLMLLRDMATAGRRTASPEAAMALLTIQNIAGEYCLAEIPVGALDACRRALVRIYTGARDLDHVFTNGR